MRSCESTCAPDNLLPVPPYALSTFNYSDDELLESFGSDAYSVDASRRKSADYQRGWSRSPRFGRPDVLYLPPPPCDYYATTAAAAVTAGNGGFRSATAPRRNASADELESSLHYAPPTDDDDVTNVCRYGNGFHDDDDDEDDIQREAISFRTFIGDSPGVNGGCSSRNDPVVGFHVGPQRQQQPHHLQQQTVESANCRQRFIDQLTPHRDRQSPPQNATKPEVHQQDLLTATVARCARRTLTSGSLGQVIMPVSCSPEFVVRRRATEQTSTPPTTVSGSGSNCRRQQRDVDAVQPTSTTSRSSPTTPTVARPHATSLKARKREKSTAALDQKVGVDPGCLRRANSLVGPASCRSGSSSGLQGDEGFADGRGCESRRATYSPRGDDDLPSTSGCFVRRDGSATTASRSQSVPSGLSTSDRARKRSYRVGLNLFNKNPEQGILYLRERNFLDLRPSATAKFLIARKGLSKQMIGEYLGSSPTPFITQVLRSFAQQIDLSNLEIDVALRKFQSFFRMPGEAQKIERIIEVFANQYCICNPDTVSQFVSADTVFLLAFAIMMLNTDLHNKNVRADRKMKLDDFIRNLRGIDGGCDVDVNLLSAMYERIRVAEFAPGEDHVMQVMRVELMLVGKKPQLSNVLHRRLVCYCRLQEVIDPGRHQRLTQHQREVFLFNDILLVAKIVGRHKNALSYSYRQSLSLTSMGVYLFEGAYYRYGICLTNTKNDKVLIMLLARNEHDRKNFVDDLKEAILENSEMQAVESEATRVKETSNELLKQSNVNRYSNDSGVVDVDVIRTPEVAEIHRLTVNGTSRPRPHSVHNSISGSDHGSAASLESGLVNVHVHGQNIGMIQLH